MVTSQDASSVEAWLEWFDAHEYHRCRAHLCNAYRLQASDADILINNARTTAFLYWETLRCPRAYFWTILRHRVWAYLRRLNKERQELEAYAFQRQFRVQDDSRASHHVADVLRLATPQQRRLLVWFIQGYDDGQVAGWLGTTPHAVRQARYAAYVALRKRWAQVDQELEQVAAE